MKFRTEYIPLKSGFVLDPRRPVVLIGSCFAQNMAAKMKECLWPVFSDAGTLYNPLSIARVLDSLILDPFLDKRESVEIPPSSAISNSIFSSEDFFHSWLFDSHFSAKTEDGCYEKIMSMRSNLVNTLESAQTLVVTFGTAWCYFLKDREDYVVANCHKMPQSLFIRRRIAIDEICSVWSDLCARLKSRFPNLNFIFTVSPVRHLKDGFEGNARSKAALLLAVEKIVENLDDSVYFPSYEILNDDLRDYRFYASDLVHPSEEAVEYLWEIFQYSFLDSKGIQTLKEGNRLFRRQNHRPIKS